MFTVLRCDDCDWGVKIKGSVRSGRVNKFMAEHLKKCPKHNDSIPEKEI